MMSAPICCIQCARSSIAGRDAKEFLNCSENGPVGWGHSCEAFSPLHGNRPAAIQAAGPQRSEDRTACAVAVSDLGTESATRARAPALGKTIRTLPSTSGAVGGTGA